jgi:hypothetical protein
LPPEKLDEELQKRNLSARLEKKVFLNLIKVRKLNLLFELKLNEFFNKRI